MTNKARDFAIKWHGDQMYGDKPYVYHLDQVADNVSAIGYGSWEPEYTAAYLHDVHEDTNCSYLDILKEFGTDVTDAIIALSKVEGEAYDRYIWRVKQNEIAWTVKIADTKANLRQSIVDDDKNRIVKYAKQLMLLEG